MEQPFESANEEQQSVDRKDQQQMLTSGEEILYELLFSDVKNKPASQYSSNKRQTLDESFMYLQELTSYHVDRLQTEPIFLHDKERQIENEIESLAFSNYKTFIRTAQCSREIYADFSVIDSKLDQLIQKLPEFGQLCDNFTKNIQIINQSRRANNLTLQKHNQLLELLEISQLMDTCVRNEYYEEALDLASYVKRLEKKYSTSIPLIHQIVQDVNKSLNLMLKQLLQQLKTNLQFNQCLKIIGIIRRLDVFSESELRIKFLQLRDAWLQSLLSNIPQIDPYNHITKTIEENRIHLFDIITQYRAIFSDDDLLAGVNNSTRGLNESKLFLCWLQQKIKSFLQILRKDLKLGVGNRIDSVMSQSMYFGLAFSRVGLDFRALMMPIFEEAILEQFKNSLKTAVTKFKESMEKLNWSELMVESSKLSTQMNQSKPIEFSSTSNLIVNPPLALIEYQPLAIYLNTILQSFNELRLCLPLTLHGKVLNELGVSIRELGLFIKDYHKRAKLDKNEAELFSSFLYELAYVMIPFIEKCYLFLFPIDQLQKAYGISTTHLDKFKESVKLNRQHLLESIDSLLPKEIVPIVQQPEPKVEEASDNNQQIETNNADVKLDSIVIETDKKENETNLDTDVAEKDNSTTTLNNVDNNNLTDNSKILVEFNLNESQ